MSYPSTPDQQIALIAADQHGIITTEQMTLCDLSRSAISRRVHSGRLFRIYRGVYAVGHRTLSYRARCMAALLAVGGDAALAGQCAADFWNIRRGKPATIEIVSSRFHRGLPGVIVRRSRTLHASEIVVRDCLRVTTVARTLVDLADVLETYELVALIRQAEFRRRLNLRSVRATLARNFSRPGRRVLEHALLCHANGSSGTESDLEVEMVQQEQAAGVRVPELNVVIEVPGDRFRVDQLFERERVIVEVDGSPHLQKHVQLEDKRRDEALTAAGYRVVRITGDVIERRDGQAVRLVERALAAAATRT